MLSRGGYCFTKIGGICYINNGFFFATNLELYHVRTFQTVQTVTKEETYCVNGKIKVFSLFLNQSPLRV